MSRKTMPYHRRYHGDALQGYTKLNLEERGAYTTILDLIYDAGGPIDYSERWLSGQMNCSLRKVRALIERLIELRKIYVTLDGKISNRRCEDEISKSISISIKRAESASKPKRPDPESYRDPYGLAREKHAKTSRKRAENELKHEDFSSETRKYTSKINGEGEQMQNESAVIPVPVPYNNILGTVSEDTAGHLMDDLPTLDVSSLTENKRLIDALEGRGKGRGALQIQLDRQRAARSRGGR